MMPVHSATWVRSLRVACVGVAMSALWPFAVLAQGAATPGSAAAIYAKLPVMFEANQGQTDARVKFFARGPGYLLFLTREEAVLNFDDRTGATSDQRSVLRLKFMGASPGAHMIGRDELRGKTNYLLGNDPKQWHRDVPNYAAAEYQDLYSGVNALFHGSPAQDGRQRLEFDFAVSAGADPRRVVLEVNGAQELKLSREGDVLIGLAGQRKGFAGQEVVLGKPHIYQEIAGRRQEVSGEFRLRAKHQLAFALGPYDHSRRLIIDPTLSYSTYVTGGQINGIALNPAAVDAGGNPFIYIIGTTGGGPVAVFPNPGAYQTTCPACDFISSAFVAKYDTTQSGAASLIYATYLGPFAGSDIMPDQLGSAAGSAIAVDAAGDAYVTGFVEGSVGSNYFPTTSTATCTATNALCGTMQGPHAAFVSVLDPTGERLLASMFLGGNNSGGSGNGSAADQGTGIALDSSDNVYLTGLTNSPGLFTAGAPQQALQNGFSNGTPFVAKMNSALSQIAYYTYLGGSNNISGVSDMAKAIAVDAAGEAYVVGGTYVGACNYVSCSGSNPSFPVPSNAGFQSSPGGSNESGFLAKLNAAGTQVLYFSYVGGGVDVNELDNGTQVNAVTLDAGGNAYITGTSGQIALPTKSSSNGPVVGPSGACQTTTNGTTCPGGFVAEVSPGTSGSSSLVFLTYLGGVSADDAGTTLPTGIALDPAGDIYVAGSTSTSDMPLPDIGALYPNGVQPSATLPCISLLPNCVSPFLVEFEPGAVSVLFSGYLAGPGAAGPGGRLEQDGVAGMALDAKGNVYMAGFETTNDFPVTTSAYDSTPPTGGNSYLAMIGGLPSTGGAAAMANYTLNGQPPTLGLLGSVFSVTAPVTTTLAVPVILTNPSSTAFTISGISLVGTGSPPWSLTSVTCNGTPVALPIASPVSLGAGQSCTLQLQFAPTLVQSGQAEGLEILDNAGSSNASGTAGEQAIYLIGSGTAAPTPSFASYSINGQPIVQANALVPAVVLTADVGSTASSALLLTNTGQEPFTISGVSFPASATPPWSLTSVSCPSSLTGPPTAAAPVTLGPAQYCTINLTFAPTVLGTAEDAALTVLDTAGGSNLSGPSSGGQEFVVQGIGGQPVADYAVSSGTVAAGSAEVTYGNVQENNPATQSVTVTNNGNGPLSITAVSIAVSLRQLSSAAYWSLSKDCNSTGTLLPVTVAPGSSCVFTFQFNPAATGNFVAEVSFIDNAAQSNLTSTLNVSYSQLVKLYGVGVLPLSGQVSSMMFTPEFLNFTNTSGTQTQSVTVTNTGTQALKITEVEPFLNQGAAFSLVQQGCVEGTEFLPFPVTLPSEASCIFTFQYNAATEFTITGGAIPAAVYAGFIDNAYVSNIGSSFGNTGALQDFALLPPGATLLTDCGNVSGVGVGGGGMEGSITSGWAQTITITNTVAGRGLTGYFLVVLEGLNTTFNQVAGTTPTDVNSVYSCGDLSGSPTVVINANGVTGFGAGVPVQSASVTVQYPAGIQPVYQSLEVRAD
jgi:hypothetical protein